MTLSYNIYSIIIVGLQFLVKHSVQKIIKTVCQKYSYTQNGVAYCGVNGLDLLRGEAAT